MSSKKVDETHKDEYTPEILAVLQLLWGEGMLSPGGEAHLDSIVSGLDLAGKRVLDIGCALGGFDRLLARKYGANVVGLDVEASLVEIGRQRTAEAGLAGQVDLQLYNPGPVPFPDGSFDVVFGKDSWIHIEDKRRLFSEIFRVLKPGGYLAAGDWLRSERPYNEDMYYFFEMEGLTYHMDTLENYGRILIDTGFVDVQMTDIHAEYQVMAREEYRKLEGAADFLIPKIGREWYEHYVEDWRSLVVVVDNGDLRPGRLRAKKPKRS
jgi:phosphoethanolamine N-methyltransferase